MPAEHPVTHGMGEGQIKSKQINNLKAVNNDGGPGCQAELPRYSGTTSTIIAGDAEMP